MEVELILCGIYRTMHLIVRQIQSLENVCDGFILLSHDTAQ